MLSKHTSSSRSSSSSVSQPAKSNKDVSLSATSFYSGSDLKAMYCPVSGDPPGLYVLLFNQGVTHGSQTLKDNNLLLPYMSCLHDMSDRQLQTLMLRHYNTNGAVVVCFDEKANTRKELVNAWQKDLNEIGGEIPPGKPNSKSTGLLRSNGLCFGRFACKLRDHDQLQRCWKLLATGVGREDPFRKPKHSVSQPVFLTSFDAVLCTADSAKFKGLKPHQDIYPPPNGETGQLQALVYVHPPPTGYRRLGLAAAFYPLCDKRLWRDYMQALLCRQSTSPDVDLRHDARPSLGSRPTQRNVAIIGGPVLEKKAVKKMTDHELVQAAKKLKQPLRGLAIKACTKIPSVRDRQKFLTQWCSSAHCTWPKADTQMYDENRFALIKGLAKGNVNRQNTSANLIRSAIDCVTRAEKFGAPEKINAWLKEGGRKKRKQQDILQPSGNTSTASQKKSGNLKATNSTGMKKHKK
jgi:hypothetical protein